MKKKTNQPALNESAQAMLLDLPMDKTVSALEKKESEHYHGHRERLRQKLLSFGGTVLQDYELMELILMQAIPRCDVKPLAKEIIKTFDSFAAALNASPDDLMKIKGVKQSTVTLFAVIREASVRMLKNQVSEAPVLSNFDTLVSYCRAAMAQRKTEALRILFLDTKNNLIKDEILQEGTINQTAIYPREIAKRALELSAVSIIMVHNHPAGDLKPSKNDLAMTKTVVKALETLNINLIDHIIVSKRGFTSFKMGGYL